MSRARYRRLAWSLFAASLAACTFDKRPMGAAFPTEQHPANDAGSEPAADASTALPVPDDNPISIEVDAAAPARPAPDPAPPATAPDAGSADADDAGAVDAAPVVPPPPCQTACTTFVDIPQRLQFMAADLQALGPDGS